MLSESDILFLGRCSKNEGKMVEHKKECLSRKKGGKYGEKQGKKATIFIVTFTLKWNVKYLKRRKIMRGFIYDPH